MAERPTTAPSEGRAPTLAGRYELLRTESTGVNTASILSWDLRLKRWRSVRVARPGHEKAAERMIAVAQRAAQLEHPSLERVIDVGRDGVVAFVVRDRFVGNAAQFVARRGIVNAPWAARIVARCADGLDWAHSRNILHGHPRPEVVCFAEDGEPVLTGFGQRAVLRDDDETRAGSPWAHLAPELRQFWEPSPYTDTFALGALLYTLVVGRHATDLYYAEAYEGMMAPVPRILRSIILQACAFEPQERFPTAGALRDAVTSAMAGMEPAMSPPPWLESTQHFPNRGEFPDADAIVTEIASALGHHRPPQSNAVRVDETKGSTTLDPQTVDEVPVYTRPEPVDFFSLPSEPPQSISSEGWQPAPHAPQAPPSPQPREQAKIPRPTPYRSPSVPPPPMVPAPPQAKARSLVGATTSFFGKNQSNPMSSGVIRTAITTLVFAIAFVVVASGVAWWFATHEDRSNKAFVRAVLSEEPSLAPLVVDDKALDEAWRRFIDAPHEQQAGKAATFVKEARKRADPDLVTVDIGQAVQRLEQAMERWEASQ